MNQIRRADRRTSKLKYLLEAMGAEAMRGDITSRLRNGYEKEMVVVPCVLKYSKLYSYRSVVDYDKNDKSE